MSKRLLMPKTTMLPVGAMRTGASIAVDVMSLAACPAAPAAAAAIPASRVQGANARKPRGGDRAGRAW